MGNFILVYFDQDNDSYHVIQLSGGYLPLDFERIMKKHGYDYRFINLDQIFDLKEMTKEEQVDQFTYRMLERNDAYD